jgi:hypothetical protein
MTAERITAKNTDEATMIVRFLFRQMFRQLSEMYIQSTFFFYRQAAKSQSL